MSKPLDINVADATLSHHPMLASASDDGPPWIQHWVGALTRLAVM